MRIGSCLNPKPGPPLRETTRRVLSRIGCGLRGLRIEEPQVRIRLARGALCWAREPSACCAAGTRSIGHGRPHSSSSSTHRLALKLRTRMSRGGSPEGWRRPARRRMGCGLPGWMHGGEEQQPWGCGAPPPSWLEAPQARGKGAHTACSRLPSAQLSMSFLMSLERQAAARAPIFTGFG